MKPRILLLLPQMPQDPSSGAARTAQTAVEMAREGGFEVAALATTATERGAHAHAFAYLASAGLAPEERLLAKRGFREIRFVQRGIPYRLLDTGRFPVLGWEKTHGRVFDQLLDETLLSFRPDIVFTYGAMAGDLRRHKRIRQSGARIAFCVFNLGYLVKGLLDEMDAVLTPSEFLAARYRSAVGLESTPLPTPLDTSDVLSPEREPIFVTMVNPSVEKGLFFFVRLAEELAREDPRIAMLAIESRGTAGMVCQAGLRGGFDLRRHESIMIAEAVPHPRDIYAHARVLLAPSVVEEASGRVVPEAMINGVVPLVSDRGGLAESCHGAGFVLPLPDTYSTETRKPVDAAAVRPWIDVILRLAFDESFYQSEVAKARVAATHYHRATLTPRYIRFFTSILEKRD